MQKMQILQNMQSLQNLQNLQKMHKMQNNQYAAKCSVGLQFLWQCLCFFRCGKILSYSVNFSVATTLFQSNAIFHVHYNGNFLCRLTSF